MEENGQLGREFPGGKALRLRRENVYKMGAAGRLFRQRKLQQRHRGVRERCLVLRTEGCFLGMWQACSSPFSGDSS